MRGRRKNKAYTKTRQQTAIEKKMTVIPALVPLRTLVEKGPASWLQAKRPLKLVADSLHWKRPCPVSGPFHARFSQFVHLISTPTSN